MILCSRCDFVAFPGDCSKSGPIAALLEHWDAVHGGWSVRYPDEKPMTPDGTRLAELLTAQARYHYSRTGRELSGKWAS